MTIDEAIEVLTSRMGQQDPVHDPEADDDLKLGIEALKRVENYREESLDVDFGLLPGETEK